MVPLLSPIPVSGPFDRVGVDVLQLPASSQGDRYAVVFMDYLKKWPEVNPTKNQSAYTITKFLVEGVITCQFFYLTEDLPFCPSP